MPYLQVKPAKTWQCIYLPCSCHASQVQMTIALPFFWDCPVRDAESYKSMLSL